MKKGMRVSLKIKTVILIVLITILISVLTAYVSYVEFEKTNDAGYKEEAMDLARTAALLVDAEALKTVSDRAHEIFQTIPGDEIVSSDDWGSPEFDAYLEHFEEIYDMPEFKTVHEQLSEVQHLNIATLSSIYTAVYIQGNDGIVYAMYLVDAADEDACPPGVLDHVYDSDLDYDLNLNSHVELEPYITHTDTYGWLVTSAVPVFCENDDYAALVSLDLSMDDIKAKEQQFLMTLMLIMLFMIIAVVCVAVSVVNTFVVDPIKLLSQTALTYVKNRDEGVSFDSIRLIQNDEILDLHDSFVQMEKDLNEHIDRITKMASEKERMETELNVAAKIQMDMLPREFPDTDRMALFASITPAREVGGDFYDFFKIDDDHMALVMADVSGKGIPASLFMVIAKNTIFNRSLRGDMPDQILKDVNDRLCVQNDQGLFVTVWLGILDLNTGELVMSNAGHENPAIKRNEGGFESYVSEHCPPLGACEGLEFENEKIKLNKGDMLFVYTDGVTEAKDNKAERFGEDRLMKVLDSTCSQSADCKDLVSGVAVSLKSFTGDEEQFDDITMMAVRFK